MIYLNIRQNEMLRELLTKSEYIIADDLAESFHVSSRTVRNDLGQIRAYLHEHGVEMESIPNRGTRVTATQKQIVNLLDQIDVSPILSKDRRIQAIVLEMLVNEVNTYQSLADICDISRQTVVTLFPSIEKELKKHRLTVDKSKGVGIQIVGKEKAIRDAFIEITKDEKIEKWAVSSSLLPFYKDPTLSIARKIIKAAEKELELQYYDPGTLEVRLCYCLSRIVEGHSLEQSPAGISQMKGNQEVYDAYRRVMELYPIPENDKRYLICVLMSAAIHKLKSSGDDSDAHEIASLLMKKLQELHPLNKSDQKRFIDGLSAHLEVALYRIRNHIPIKNELLEQIKISISLIYEYTKQQLLECEQHYGLRFEESEIAFIAMYVASAFENSIKLDMQVNVMVVCSFGTTTSAILGTRMKQLIPECRIIGPYSRSQAAEYVRHNRIDLIISTNIDEFGDIPVINVNPLLCEDDMESIKPQIFQIAYSKMCSSFLSSYASSGKTAPESLCLGRLVEEDAIQIVETCESWQKAIQLAAEPLLAKRKIEQSYVDQMIRAVKQLGTYMVMAPETAFVHAGTEDGIYDDCASVLVLRKPIKFGELNSKQVRNIVVLGIKNRGRTSLLDLVYIFADPSNRERLESRRLSKSDIEKLHR